MKSNACYEGLFRVKLVGFGSSSNFCNKKIMKKKKKNCGSKKRKGAGTRNKFFSAKSRKHFVLTGILSKDIQSIEEYPLSLFCLFSVCNVKKKKNSMRKRVVS